MTKQYNTLTEYAIPAIIYPNVETEYITFGKLRKIQQYMVSCIHAKS